MRNQNETGISVEGHLKYSNKDGTGKSKSFFDREIFKASIPREMLALSLIWHYLTAPQPEHF